MMKPIVYIIIIVCLFFTGISSSVNAQVAATSVISGSILVSDLINNLKNSLSTVISQLSADVSKNSFETRQHLEILAQTLDQLGQGLIGKTFDQLNDTQKNLFTEINSTIKSFESKANITLDRVDQIVTRTNDMFGTLPFANLYPRVLKYSPAYVFGTAQNGQQSQGYISIRVDGSWLGIGSPALTFSEKRCELQSKTETSLTFNCPKSIFIAESKVESISGVLTVFRNKNLLEKIKDLFVTSSPTIEYKVGLFAVPNTMGTYKINTTVTTTTTERVSRTTQQYYHRNGHCEGRREIVWTHNATPGWRIDVNSIQVHEFSKNGDTQNHGAFNRSESGFQLGGTVRNGGGPCFGPINDARGWLGVTATYDEIREVSGSANGGSLAGTLQWGKDLAVELPSGTSAFLVEINQLDGKVHIDTGRTDRSWYSIDYNPSNRQLIIRPAALEIALNQ